MHETDDRDGRNERYRVYTIYTVHGQCYMTCMQQIQYTVCIPSLIKPPVQARSNDEESDSGEGDDDRHGHATNESGASTSTSTPAAGPPVIYRMSGRTARMAPTGGDQRHVRPVANDDLPL